MQREGYAVDLHVKVLDEGVVERAKARDLDALVYAPHFTRLPEIRRQAESFSDEDLTVFPAREVFTGTWQQRRHVLAIGLEEPVPDFITFDGAMRELQRQGAAVLVPHPGFLNVSLGFDDIETYRESIDALEVYSPKQLPHHWERARSFAEETGHETFASSYAHITGTIGEAYVTFNETLDDVTDLRERLKNDAERTLFRQDGISHMWRRAMEWAHLGLENTWGKFDRLMLQGTEPTHPDHVAYESRFDDVKVY
ncbi:MAG: PHP-associated domain-containing protein [Haloarcula sp.]